MNGGQNTQGCGRYSEALLPTRPAEAEQELLRHAAACPACGELLARRAAIAAELAALPRRAAPTDRGAALSYPAVGAQLDVARFERELARGEATMRALLQRVPHHRAPSTLDFERIASALRPALQSSLGTPPRSSGVLTFRRRVASCAAAAVVGLSLWPLLQDAPPASGFAAETAALSDRPSLVLRIVELESQPDADGVERGRLPPAAPQLPGRAWLPVRGGP